MGKESLIIKIGSDTVVIDGQFDDAYARDVAAQIAKVRAMGFNTILVSSGAVALGEHFLGSDASRADLDIAGQKILKSGWEKSFADSGLSTREILVAEGQLDLAHHKIGRSLEEGHVPLINGDDSAHPPYDRVSLGITHNNDRVATWIALNWQANLLLLTNVDGVYNEQKVVKPVIFHPNEVIIFDTKSAHGTGGMGTKVEGGFAVAATGRRAGIANGRRSNVISDFISKVPVGTEFLRK